MRRRSAIELGLLGVLCIGIVACDASSYELLDQTELAFVIPDSESWGSGEPCAEADCGGPVDVGSLAESSWAVVESIALVNGAAGERDTVTVELKINRSARGGSMGDSITARGWGEDIEAAQNALDAGNEVWAATQCPGLESDYLCHLIAIDSQDRFAGLGYGATLYLTTPLAEGAAAAQAESGRGYLESLILENGNRTPGASPGTQSGGPSVEGAPAVVANREPLFYCGAEVIEGLGPSSNPYEDIEVVDGASSCYHERATAGQPSEMILLMVTIEGDPIMQIRRFMPDGREILFWDTTQDDLGAMAWLMIECDSYTGPDQTDGICGNEVILD